MSPVFPHTPVRAESPRAIVTNGEGKATTAHLNLTRTFADIIADKRDFLRIERSPKRRRK